MRLVVLGPMYAYELRRLFAWVHWYYVPQVAQRMPADQAPPQGAGLQAQATAIGARSKWSASQAIWHAVCPFQNKVSCQVIMVLVSDVGDTRCFCLMR